MTHRQSGAFKEDCGAGDSTDKSLATAVNHALKASVTDALKRAVRHFGDKLGNSLYDGSFSISKAPRTLKDALNHYEIDRAKSKFGFEKDRVKDHVQHQDQELPGLNGSSDLNTSTTSSGTRIAHGLHASSPVSHASPSVLSISATPVAKSYGNSHGPVRKPSTTKSVAGTNIYPNTNGTSKANQSSSNGSKSVVSTSVQNTHIGNNMNSNANPSAININRHNSSSKCTGSADTSNIIVPTKSVTVTASNASGYNTGHYVYPNAVVSGSTGTDASTIVSTHKPSGNTSSANSNGFSNTNNLHALQATGKSPNGLNRFQRNPANKTPSQPQHRSTHAAVTAQSAIGVGIDSTAVGVGGTVPTTSTHGPSFVNGSRPNPSSSITRQYQPINSSVPAVPAPGHVTNNALLDITTSRTANVGMGGGAQNSNGKRNIDGDGSGSGSSGSVAKKMVPYNGTNPYLNSKK